VQDGDVMPFALPDEPDDLFVECGRSNLLLLPERSTAIQVATLEVLWRNK
jgi:hypothetical protein